MNAEHVVYIDNRNSFMRRNVIRTRIKPALCGAALLFSATFARGDSAGHHSATWTCPKNGADVSLSESLYETGTIGSLLAQLLSGNTRSAIKDMSGEIVNNIVILNSQLERNPCGISSDTLSRVYPMLRVIAAINHEYSIPGLADNKEAMTILRRAIINNPENYKELLKRAKTWQNGIK